MPLAAAPWWLAAALSLPCALEAARRLLPAGASGSDGGRCLASAVLAAAWVMSVGPADSVVLLAAECALIVWLMLLPPLPAPASKEASQHKAAHRPALAKQASLLLSDEETAAVEACKRIIAKARKKFLDANGGFVPMASNQVQSYMDAAYAKFKQNLDLKKSSEGREWVLTSKDDKREISIYSAPFQGQTARWKVVATLQSDLETAYDAVFDPTVRRKWDPMVKDISMLQINDVEKEIGDGMAVSSIVTASAAGGLVKSRTLLDFGMQRTNPQGGIHIANCSIPESFPEYALGPLPGSDGMVRAISHVGSGCSLQPIPGRPGILNYVLVSTIDLSGWLMPSVVNAAMSTSLMQGTVQMQEFLKGTA